MKFEQVLKIYWSKGFFYNGVLFNFDVNLDFLIKNSEGIGPVYRKLIIRRFEMQKIYKNRFVSLIEYPKTTHSTLNKLFSKTSSINSPISEVVRYNIIRLYLIRSYRGRAQAMGKPSRGQRTWSNAWTAHYSNFVIKSFISLVRRIHAEDKRPEKIDYRKIQKKYVKSKRKGVFKKQKIKLNAWF